MSTLGTPTAQQALSALPSPQQIAAGKPLSEVIMNVRNSITDPNTQGLLDVAEAYVREGEKSAKKAKAVTITFAVLILVLLIGILAATAQTARNVRNLPVTPTPNPTNP